MITFPNCKINIGLEIIRKRGDGYHDLSTVFYPVRQLHDSLEIMESEDFSITTHGIDLPIDTQHNIVYKAFKLLQEKYKIPNVKVELVKHIPHGAGLGGGSSDASAMLMLLNNFFNLNIDTATLKSYASELGSDCSFFIYNKPCYAQGRGEVLEPIALNLDLYKIVIIKPHVHISTAEAFSNVVCRDTPSSLIENIKKPIATWRDNIINDFEKSIFVKHKLLQEIKQKLYDTNAIYASMSGSGSSIYGIFEQHQDCSSMRDKAFDFFEYLL